MGIVMGYNSRQEKKKVRRTGIVKISYSEIILEFFAYGVIKDAYISLEARSNKDFPWKFIVVHHPVFGNTLQYPIEKRNKKYNIVVGTLHSSKVRSVYKGFSITKNHQKILREVAKRRLNGHEIEDELDRDMNIMTRMGEIRRPLF